MGEIVVDVEHPYSFLLGFLTGGMGGVPFLPQEFGSAEKQTGAHFPTHHVCPLVDEDGKVAIRCNPVLIRVPYDGFRGRADNKLFFQLGLRVDNHTGAVGIVFQTVVGHDGTLFGKPLDMLRFAAEE